MTDGKPTIDQVRPLLRALYEHSPAGCCLHIVLDDGNVADSHVRFCIDYAKERGHDECRRLGEILLRMSKTQRTKLYRRKYAD